jgi:hypothetical protein
MVRRPLRRDNRDVLTALVLVLAFLVAATPASAGARPATYGAGLGSHSMLYLNTRPAEQEAMFRATAKAGVRYLRMDFAVGLVFPYGERDYRAVERVDALGEEYGIEVLGVITTTPGYLAACPGGTTDHLDQCAPARQHERTWRTMVMRMVRHAPHVRHWELGNEPDNGSTVMGGPAEYARWAALAAAGIRAASPDASIAIGGLAHLNAGFLEAALHDRRYPLIDRVDIANVHVRGTLASIQVDLAAARALYARLGFAGRLWVTETGYPSRPSHQWEPAFQGGPRDQARWLTLGLRALIDGGADAVFVSFRDNHEFGRGSPFGSEGVLRWPRLDRDGNARPKPAYAAVRRLARLTR